VERIRANLREWSTPLVGAQFGDQFRVQGVPDSSIMGARSLARIDGDRDHVVLGVNLSGRAYVVDARPTSPRGRTSTRPERAPRLRGLQEAEAGIRLGIFQRGARPSLKCEREKLVRPAREVKTAPMEGFAIPTRTAQGRPVMAVRANVSRRQVFLRIEEEELHVVTAGFSWGEDTVVQPYS